MIKLRLLWWTIMEARNYVWTVVVIVHISVACCVRYLLHLEKQASEGYHSNKVNLQLDEFNAVQQTPSYCYGAQYFRLHCP